jgi:hypothetical protein
VESWAPDAEEVLAADTAAEIPQARRPDSAGAAAEIPEARRPAAAETPADADETAADPAPEQAADAAEPRAADADASAVADPAAERADAAELRAADVDASAVADPTAERADAVESRAADDDASAVADPIVERADAAEPRAADADAAQADDAAPERAADADEARDAPPPLGDAQRDAAEDDGRIGGVMVRPYVRTGGRTRPAVDLAIEALVSTAPGAPEPPGADHRAITALCASPRSVAEIAALLEIPLGVARVLVGDLAQDGAVVVHGTSGPDGPDATFMQRVLDGLRRL